MRDAFGGTFMLKLLLIFFVVFISFMTLAASYAKIFRVKNGVIDILETYKFDINNQSDINTILNGHVDNYLKNMAYNTSLNNTVIDNCKNKGGILSGRGACVSDSTIGDKNNYHVYTVTVYLTVNLPFFGYSAVMPISGEYQNYNTQEKIKISK